MLSFMTSRQHFFCQKWELTKSCWKRLDFLPIFWSAQTAFLLMPLFFAFLKAQTFQGLSISVRFGPLAIVVAQVITSKGWPSSVFLLLSQWLCHLSTFGAFFSKELDSGYPIIIIFGMILPLVVSTTMLFLWLFDTLLTCKSLHVNKKRFGLAFAQFFRYHITQFFASIDLPHFCMQFSFFSNKHTAWMDSLTLVTSWRPESTLVIRHNKLQSLINAFFI